MAKGLFSVYQDDDVPSRPHASASSSTNNKPRRKPLASKLANKENCDPLSIPFSTKPSPSSGNCSGKKVVRASHQLAPVENNNNNKPPVLHVPSKTAHLQSDNGICTGTLTTRILPSLPPLANDSAVISPPRSKRFRSNEARTTNNTSSTSTLYVDFDDGSNVVQPSEAREISLPPLDLVESCGAGSASGTPNSARDSGYCPSTAGTHDDEDREAGFEVDHSSITMLDEASGEESDGDRRARALTESPLAEITQAFTSQGHFRLPPSPSRIRESISHSPSTSPTRPRNLVQRSAPYPEYSKTATTRKSKSTAPAVSSLANDLKSMRF